MKDKRVEEILARLEALGNPEAAEGMRRYGIVGERIFGVSIPSLRKIAREIGRDYELAMELWNINSRETRILASMIAEPARVTEEIMESWVKEFDNWELCDQVCQNLFQRTPFVHKKAVEWSGREEEFVKRAAFVLMARLAVADKKAPDSVFEEFLPVIKGEATDGRVYVRKAISWALRQIGKRNAHLNKKAIELAEEIGKINSKSAKWISRDVLRELKSERIQKRMKS